MPSYFCLSFSFQANAKVRAMKHVKKYISDLCLSKLFDFFCVIFEDFCIRTTGSGRTRQQLLPLLCGNLPSAFHRHVLHPKITRTKKRPHHLPPAWGKAGCMWGVSYFRRIFLHRLEERKHQLDAPVHHQVILSYLSC